MALASQPCTRLKQANEMEKRVADSDSTLKEIVSSTHLLVQNLSHQKKKIYNVTAAAHAHGLMYGLASSASCSAPRHAALQQVAWCSLKKKKPSCTVLLYISGHPVVHAQTQPSIDVVFRGSSSSPLMQMLGFNLVMQECIHGQTVISLVRFRYVGT